MSDIKQANTGDTVVVHYTGKLEDGTVFDTSRERGPVEFTLGEGMVIKGFETALVGMKPGESKTAKLPADQAYGVPRDDLKFDIERERLPEGLEPAVGQVLQMQQANGGAAPVTVVDVNEKAVTLDANHPLAGKTLVFDIELVRIQAPDATPS